MPSFRAVDLPAEIRGRLYLHSLPGRFEPLAECWREVRDRRITAIACLIPDAEIASKSAAYLEAIEGGRTPCPVWRFPIVDYGVPADREAFARLLDRAAGHLRDGGALLAHCAAGIGRTGTFAAGVLIRLGLDPAEAATRVRAAGSYAERPVQADLLDEIAGREGA